MRTSPYLGLTVWDQNADRFNYGELARNFDLIDAHDHSFGKGISIDTGGLVDLSVTAPKIADDSVGITALADGTVSTTNIQTPGAFGSFTGVVNQKIATGSILQSNWVTGTQGPALGASLARCGATAPTNPGWVPFSTTSLNNAVGFNTTTNQFNSTFFGSGYYQLSWAVKATVPNATSFFTTTLRTATSGSTPVLSLSSGEAAIGNVCCHNGASRDMVSRGSFIAGAPTSILGAKISVDMAVSTGSPPSTISIISASFAINFIGP